MRPLINLTDWKLCIIEDPSPVCGGVMFHWKPQRHVGRFKLMEVQLSGHQPQTMVLPLKASVEGLWRLI